MSANISDVTDESLRREEDRRKRPDVQHYKPGALHRKPEPEELIPGFSSRRDQRHNRGGSRRNAENRKPGGKQAGEPETSQNSSQEKAPQPERIGQQDDARTDKRKKPEIEHYVPKKVQGKGEPESVGARETGRIEEEKGIQDSGGGGTKKRKNKKGKGKDKDKPGAAEPSENPNPAQNGEIKNSKNKDKPTPKQNDDIPARQVAKNAPRRDPKPDVRKKDDIDGKKPSSDRKDGKQNEFRVPEPPLNRNRDGRQGSGRDTGSDKGGHGLDRSFQGSNARGQRSDRGFHTADRGYSRADKDGFSRTNPKRWSQDADQMRRGESEPKGYWGQAERNVSFGRGGGKGGGRRGGSRGNSPQRSYRGDSRGNSPQRGNRGRWSRGSSPSRSSRGNSPNRSHFPY